MTPPHTDPKPQVFPEPAAADSLLPEVVRRNSGLFVAIGLGLALVGLLRGFQHRPLPPRPDPVEHVADEESVPAAVTYGKLPEARLRPNAGWQSNLATLQFDRPGVFDPVVRTEETRQAALADRSRNRAYDGAPPTIPHPVQPGGESSCLACHGEGIRIGDRVASKVSHPHYSNCTQCHVEADHSGMRLQVASREGDFVGVYRSGPGTRASPGAPPTIPHTTWMREDCASCHGLVARPGLRTTHPWLTNCTQCHAPSAERDQVAFPPPAAADLVAAPAGASPEVKKP